MQPGEGELDFGLHARRTYHPAALPVQLVKQRGLAHARLAAHHQHPALTGPYGRDQAGQHASLGTPVPQPGAGSA